MYYWSKFSMHIYFQSILTLFCFFFKQNMYRTYTFTLHAIALHSWKQQCISHHTCNCNTFLYWFTAVHPYVYLICLLTCLYPSFSYSVFSPYTYLWLKWQRHKMKLVQKHRLPGIEFLYRLLEIHSREYIQNPVFFYKTNVTEWYQCIDTSLTAR